MHCSYDTSTMSDGQEPTEEELTTATELYYHSDCGWGSVELISAPMLDYRDIIDRKLEAEEATHKQQQRFLEDRAHMLRKKWLPHRPKKVTWRKG